MLHQAHRADSLDHLGVLLDGVAWVRPDETALKARYREHMRTEMP